MYKDFRTGKIHFVFFLIICEPFGVIFGGLEIHYVTTKMNFRKMEKRKNLFSSENCTVKKKSAAQAKDRGNLCKPQRSFKFADGGAALKVVFYCLCSGYIAVNMTVWGQNLAGEKKGNKSKKLSWSAHSVKRPHKDLKDFFL